MVGMVKTQLPGFRFWGWGGIGVWQTKRRGDSNSTKTIDIENQGLPTCDSLHGSREPNWKSRFNWKFSNGGGLCAARRGLSSAP
ncbi:hypothetical protein SBA4_4600007 [Candidatus Sulfopaludibacter sp. SbA4]|nr:hypothetical protein SBA4_4600007 [Candidatus Sulfopaludibacter sp. SbA4]